MNKNKLGALALLTAAIFCAAAAIAAAEVSTAEYTEAVEPICQRNTSEIEADLKGLKGLVKRGKLKPASLAVAKAAGALQSAYNQLKAVPEPAASEATLGKWLGYLNTEVSLTRATSKALKQGQRSKASHEESQLLHYSNLANAAVFGFHFHYCHSELSKFV
jgi:hypothetical protein